jgi:hypothetical protein
MERYYIRLQSKKEDYNFRNALKLKQMTNTITEFAEFNHAEFAEQVIEELNYTEMTRITLAKAIYVYNSRLKGVLADGLKFKPEEVSRIRKILGIQ